VYYAAEIGGLGLDLEVKSDRMGVFKMVHSGIDSADALCMMDMSVPYQPERSHYMVAEICVGMHACAHEEVFMHIVTFGSFYQYMHVQVEQLF
jgi:hypothetical protein